MHFLFWGLTISLVGKVLLAIGVLMAHSQIAHERRIDQKVIRSIRTEQLLTYLGLILIIIGYFLEIYFYGFTPFFNCNPGDCMASLEAAFSQ